MHRLLEQIWPESHLAAHLPQLLRSLVVSTQIPEQSVSPVGQTHLLAEQILPPVHLVPQEPQLLVSLVRLTHEPEQAV
jgi:hypothetical protein